MGSRILWSKKQLAYRFGYSKEDMIDVAREISLRYFEKGKYRKYDSSKSRLVTFLAGFVATELQRFVRNEERNKVDYYHQLTKEQEREVMNVGDDEMLDEKIYLNQLDFKEQILLARKHRTLTTKEAAEFLGVSTRTIRNWL